MARKIRAKLILELRAKALSRNAIAKAYGMSKRTVCEMFDLADELDIRYEEVRERTDDEVYRMFFPNRNNPGSIYQDPDWGYVHAELARTGVTLKLLHAEYCDKCAEVGNIAMGYNRFCKSYDGYTTMRSVTSHIEHKPAVRCEVDWSGPTMDLVDELAGEMTKVYLFVATLPYSQYSYVEPTLDMKEKTWIRCNIHMLEFFGGSPVKIVPDNLKTGVTSHPKEGEIVLNESYLRFAEHYLVAIMPAGVRKPKHKPSVEGTVGMIATAIIAALRNEIFHDFPTLRLAVAKCLDEFNAKDFQKREGSRKLVFESQEKPLLRELPAVPYEVCTWVYGRKVALNSHVPYGKNFYSVNHRFIGMQVDLRVTDTLLEVYAGGERLATHPLKPSYVTGEYSTHDEDMPDGLVYHEWDDARITGWADSIGDATGTVIRRLLGSCKVKQQAYNPCLSVLGLAKKCSPERLELACGIALERARVPRYRNLKQILETNQDKTKPRGEGQPHNKSDGYVRGAEYYGGEGR